MKNEEKYCHDTSNSRSNTKLPWTELDLPPAAPLHCQRKIGGSKGVGTSCTQTVRSADQVESLKTWGDTRLSSVHSVLPSRSE